jgi:hypothetical protein
MNIMTEGTVNLIFSMSGFEKVTDMCSAAFMTAQTLLNPPVARMSLKTQRQITRFGMKAAGTMAVLAFGLTMR